MTAKSILKMSAVVYTVNESLPVMVTDSSICEMAGKMIGPLRIVALLTCVLVSASPLNAWGGGSSVHDAVAKAIPFIQDRGDWWIGEKKCVSCHRISFMTWALSDAQALGFDIDGDRLAELRDWTREALLSVNEKAGKRVGELNLEGVSQVLWQEGQSARDESPAEQTAQFVKMIRDGRRDDGLWNAAGQLPSQKRPKSETELVSSMWSVLALELNGVRTDNDRLADALDSTEESASTEWYAMRLLLAAERADKEGTSKWIDALRDLQQADGGWGWLKADPSDALATGQALYALRFAGVPRDDPAVSRAVEFLTTTQNDDGRWTVMGTKQASKDRAEETATYWGTCWAVIGLLSRYEPTP